MVYEYEKETLSNGLEVIIEPRPERKVVGIELMVKSGSMNQSEDNRGIMHLIEHLLGNGSENYPGKGEAEEEITKRGGYINMGTTSLDTTVEGTVNKEDKDKLINTMIDIAFKSKLKYFKEEKEIIEAEILEFKDDEEEIVEKNLEKIMYENNYLLDILGTTETVKSLEKQQVKELYKDIFHPNNASISLVGPLEKEETLDKIEKLTKDLEKKKEPERKKLKLIENPEDILEEKECSSTYLRTGIHLPGRNFESKDYWNILMLNEILGSSEDISFLYKKLRKDKNLVYHVHSLLGEKEEACSIEMETSFEPKKREKVEENMKKVIKNLPENLDEEKLREFKSYVKGEEKMMRDDVLFEASELNDFNLYNCLSYLNEKINKIEEIELEEIKETADKYLKTSELFTSVVKPP